jgi:hypothetical protein
MVARPLGIENREHYVRDVTFREERSQILNAAISLLRLGGYTNSAHALRHHAYKPLQFFAKLGMTKQWIALGLAPRISA